jgi:predicted AAA+ superfamily ATPase
MLTYKKDELKYMFMDKIVERDVFASIKEHLMEPEITLIHGARQVGKTTIMHCLMDYLKQDLLVDKSQILYYNLDLFYEYEKLIDQKAFVQYLKEKCANGAIYLFIDEAQYLTEAGRYLKGIYDLSLPIKMVVTGSSSLLLARNTKESLMGRKQVFTVGTFSFHEYIAYHQKELLSLLSERNLSSINRGEILENLFRYLLFGGYPLVVLSSDNEQKERRLQEIYSSYIDKDISQFLEIKNKIGFARVMSILASQIGNLVNMTEVASTSQISHLTIKHYLESMECTYMVSLLRPYTTNIRSELVKMPKIYFSDLGFRNCTLKGFSSSLYERDKGVLLENFIYTELNRMWSGKVHFWRLKDGSEVDFVLNTGNGTLIPIEVKASYLKKPIIPASLRSFLRSYAASDAYIVNLSLELDVKEGETTFHFILPWQLSLINQGC